MIEIANDFGLDQVESEPTRGKNTLNLFLQFNTCWEINSDSKPQWSQWCSFDYYKCQIKGH